jgi:hypothetical protein
MWNKESELLVVLLREREEDLMQKRHRKGGQPPQEQDHQPGRETEMVQGRPNSATKRSAGP